ncbi:MAG: DNA translocase FtsK, partial [Candidatus Pacebacteria bacterium]|nr:DNA translocase FtsK [Candidatus Paceibacterota bacterium]
MISFTGQGKFLALMNQVLGQKLGLSMLFLPFVFISAGLVMFQTKWAWSKPSVLLGTVLLMLASLGLFQSGQIGEQTFINLARLISPAGSYLVFAAVLIIGILIILQLSFKEIFEVLANLKLSRKASFAENEPAAKSATKKGFHLPKLTLPFAKKDLKINQNDSDLATDSPSTAVDQDSATDQELALKHLATSQPSSKAPATKAPDLPDGGSLTTNTPMVWDYPPLSLLSAKPGGKADRGDVRSNAQIIENTLDSFGIKAKVAEVNYGPSVTQYALEITRGTKLSKITSLSNDLALALAAPTGQIRIEAPIAGRSLVGVEVPNRSAQYVTLKQMLSSNVMKQRRSKLAVALGINVAGKPVIADIATMPHLLIAGATGSGKSVCINAFMCSILFRASPAEVKFILVDPKRVELTGYNGIPHLLTPVIIEPKKVVAALKWATDLMDKRYKQLAEVGVKNIDAYNELAGLAAMPHIVVVIDELADIMLFAPGEVEETVTRIAQMARAVGIHLVLSTQRPSVDVITGLIKANIPARIAFNVSSMTDSRVILDMPGAEKLLGRGDMLFIPPDQSKPSRIQGTFVSDREAKSLIDFIKSQGQEPEYKEEVISKYQAVKVGGSGLN